MSEYRHEYLLFVWAEKPQDLRNLFANNYWKGHVRNAREMPKIGETLTADGFTEWANYGVFDVRHPIGTLHELILQDAPRTQEATLP
jgi:hypothetical protein